MINLNGSNYIIWKGKMEDFLHVKGYHTPVFESKKPVDKTDED